MEWFFYIIVIVCLIDIEEKLKKITNNNLSDKITLKNKIILEDYLNKEVYIILNDDTEISDQHLFSVGGKTIGKIIDYDSTWLLFEYYNKYKKQTIHQYIRIKDIDSIDQIN